MLQTVSPPIIRSSKLYTQHLVYVKLSVAASKLDNTRCCVYSFELLKMGGETA
jgi:hypothetical protein